MPLTLAPELRAAPRGWQPRLRAARLSAAAWGAVALVHFGFLEAADARDRLTLLEAVAIAAANGALWLALTPAIVELSRRLRRGGETRAAAISVHVAAALACAVLAGWVQGALAGWSGFRPEIPLLPAVLYYFDLHIFLYAATVLVSRTLDRSSAVVRSTRHLLALERQMTDARLQFLTQQLQPHFLFNCLNAVAELAIEAPAQARRMLAHLRRLVSASLEHRAHALVPLGDELAMLEPYLELERIRFADRLEVRVDVADAARAALIPPLVLQPLVENAIRHGLARLDGGGRVTLTARADDGRLVVEVEDNGTGLTDDPRPRGLGIGLANSEERLRHLFPGASRLELEPAASGGARVTLELPFMHAADRPASADAASAEARDADAGDVAGDARDEIDPGDRRERTRARVPAWVLLPVCWAIIGLLQGTQMNVYLRLRMGRMPPLAPEYEANLTWAATWMVLTPVVLALARWLPMSSDRLASGLAVHTALAVATAIGNVYLLHALGLWGPAGSFLHPTMVNGIVLNVVVYVLLVTWVHGRRLTAWYEARQTTAARMQARIAEARWRTAAVALQPRAITEILEALEAELLLAPRRGEQRIVRFAELLHRMLSGGSRGMVPLGEELAALRAVLELRRVVREEVPELDWRGDDDVLGATVPQGVLRLVAEHLMPDSGADELDVMEVEARETADGVEIAVRVPARVSAGASADRTSPARTLRLPAGVRIASATADAVTVLVVGERGEREAGGDWPALDAHAAAHAATPVAAAAS